MTTAAAMAGAFLAMPAAAQAEAAGGTSAQSVHRASISCSSPKGAKTNYSWGDGVTTVTVYFNNHCSHRVYAKLHIKNSLAGDYTKCLATNGHTKGKKKFGIGGAATLTKITKGC